MKHADVPLSPTARLNSSDAPGAAATPRQRYVLVGLLLLSLAINLSNLTRKGLWTDEFRTLISIRGSFAQCAIERLENGHFPTYFTLLQGWTALAGDREWALRFPTALAVTASVAFIFLAARRLWGDRAAGWAALLYLLNARTLWAAVEARPYGFVLLCAAATMHALIAWLQDRRGRDLALWTLWALLGSVMQATFSFVFLAQVLIAGAWLIRERRWSWAWAGCAALVLTALAAGNALLARMNTIDKFFREASLPDPDLMREALIQLFWGEYHHYIWSGFKYLALPLVAALFVLAIRFARSRKPNPQDHAVPGLSLAVGWTFATLVGMVLYSALIKDIYGGVRYFMTGLGGAALIGGVAIASIADTRRRRIFGGVCLAVQLTVMLAWSIYPGHQVREAYRQLAARHTPGEPVLICKDTNADVMAPYYGFTEPFEGIDRTEDNPERLTQLLNASAGQAAGFWVLLYSDHKSELRKLAPRWAKENHFRRTSAWEYDQADIYYYARETPIS